MDCFLLIRAQVMTLCDPFGRRITDLRISITELCNFRCFYCLPFGPTPLSARTKILSDEEIERIVRVLSPSGIRKIRLTGGEPLLRPGVAGLVEKLRAIEGIETVAVTTNGSLLRRHAPDLLEAGLSYVTVSLDSLRPGGFREVCGRNFLGEVFLGIQAAKDAGLPVKINAVLLRNRTEAELFDFLDLADALDLPVRFIECMPFPGVPWRAGGCLLVPEVRRILGEKFPLLPIPPSVPSETARYFRIPGRRGCVGFIASVSAPFCDRCSRLRLTADGFLKPCLHGEAEVDLKPALRETDDGELRRRIAEAVRLKPLGHPDWLAGDYPLRKGREMVRIGG